MKTLVTVLMTMSALILACSTTQESEQNVAQQSNNQENNGDEQGSNYGNNQVQENNLVDDDAEFKDAQIPEINDSEIVNAAPLEPAPETNVVAPSLPSPPLPPVAEQVPVTRDPPVAPPIAPSKIYEPSTGQLWWIGYDYRREQKELRIQLLTKGRPQFDFFQEINRAKQPEIRVRFYDTSLRGKLTRSINASEFRGPVGYIRTQEESNYTDVVLTLREKIQPTLFSKRGNVELRFAVSDHYLSSKNQALAPEYTATDLTALDVLPKLAKDSDEPRETKLLRIPDYVGKQLDEAPQVEPAAPAAIPGPIDEGGLPVQDFDRSQGSIRITSARFSSVAQQELPVDAPASTVAPENLTLPTEIPVPESAPVQATAVDITPVLDESNGVQYVGKPIYLEFNDAPITEVLKAFSDQIGTNFLVAPAVRDIKVSIKLKQVPWDAALDALLETYQLGMAKVSDNVIRVDTVERMGTYLQTRERLYQTRMLSESRKTLMVRLSNATADGTFVSSLRAFFTMNGIDNRTTINSDQRTNTIFIEAPPYVLNRAKKLIENLDRPEPQVEIISRIIEVSRQARNFLGIAWGGSLNFDPMRSLGTGTLNFPNSAQSTVTVDPGVSTTTASGNVNLSLGSINNVIDLSLRLRMEETLGTTEILQSNRVVVADRNQASITAGQTAYFRPSQAPVILSGTSQQGGGGGAPGSSGSQPSQIQFNLGLSVTPEVTNDGQIRMRLNIESQVPSPAALPGSDISSNSRSLTTVLKKASGETAVIGGIYDTRKTKQVTGIPIFSSIPIIGALFRSDSKGEDQTELMVLITPTIIGQDKTAGTELEQFDAAEGSSNNVPVQQANPSNDGNNLGNPEEDAL